MFNIEKTFGALTFFLVASAHRSRIVLATFCFDFFVEVKIVFLGKQIQILTLLC